MGWINCTCSIIYAPPRPFMPFPFSHMDGMDSPLRLYGQHRGLIWAEQELIGLLLCAEQYWSPAHSLWQPAHPQIPYSCEYFVVSKSFFILPRRLVIQDLSNKITTAYFSLCGTMERGSEPSCNVLTWVNVECLKLWGQTAWKELMCARQSAKDKSQRVSVRNFSSSIYSLWWLITGVILMAIWRAFECCSPSIPAVFCAVHLACYTKYSSQLSCLHWRLFCFPSFWGTGTPIRKH